MILIGGQRSRTKRASFSPSAIEKAHEAVDRAKRIHEENAASLNDVREKIEKRIEAEDERWALEKDKLETTCAGVRNR